MEAVEGPVGGVGGDVRMILPCPFCSASEPEHFAFETNQGTKWGFVQCGECVLQIVDDRAKLLQREMDERCEHVGLQMQAVSNRGVDLTRRVEALEASKQTMKADLDETDGVAEVLAKGIQGLRERVEALENANELEGEIDRVLKDNPVRITQHYAGIPIVEDPSVPAGSLIIDKNDMRPLAHAAQPAVSDAKPIDVEELAKRLRNAWSPICVPPPSSMPKWERTDQQSRDAWMAVAHLAIELCAGRGVEVDNAEA